MPFADPNYFKSEFGAAGKQVLITFAPLSPHEGIEYALRALPDVIREFPNVIYIVLGQTHPNLLRSEGETHCLSQNQGAESTLAFLLSLAEKQALQNALASFKEPTRD